MNLVKCLFVCSWRKQQRETHITGLRVVDVEFLKDKNASLMLDATEMSYECARCKREVV